MKWTTGEAEADGEKPKADAVTTADETSLKDKQSEWHGHNSIDRQL